MPIALLQMNTNDPMFWVMVIIAASFLVIAIAMVAIAVFVNRAVKSVNRMESKLEPLIERVSAMSEQGKQIAVQGKLIAEQFTAVSGHLSTATQHFSESLAIIKSAYDRNETDEFITPTVLTKDGKAVAPMRDGDALIFFNYRADRMW